MVQPHYKKAIVPCITINLSNLNRTSWPQKRGYVSARFRTLLESKKGYYFSKHEYKGSRHNFDFELGNSFELLEFDQSHSEYMQETQTLSLKKFKYDCSQDNSIHFTDCMNEFYAQQLHCYLPWAMKYGTLNPCQTAEELDRYRNLSNTIFNMTKEIEEKGCFKPNCMKTTWVNSANAYKLSKKGMSQLYITVPYTAKVVRREEILLADLSTFLVDLGSYLGFFLGASILSLTDMAVSQASRFQSLIVKCTDRLNKYI